MAIPEALVEMGIRTPAATLDDPTYGLLDAAALDYGLSWEDVSSYVRSASSNRGAAQELQRIETGTASIVLNNRDKRFTPLLANSPYFPSIRPGMPVRIRATWNATTYPVFMGYAERVVVSFPGDVDNIVELQLVDGMKRLAKAAISGAFPQEASGTRISRVLDLLGFPVTGIDAGTVTVPAITLDNVKALEHIREIEWAEDGRFFFSRDGTPTFDDAGTDTPPDMSTRRWTDDGSGMSYREVIPDYSDTFVLNDVRLTRVGGTEQVATDAASDEEFGTASYVLGDVQLTSDSAVLARAEKVIDTYAEPQLRLGFLVDNAMAHGLWDRMLAREIADLIEIIESETETAQTSVIQGIRHEIGQDTWTVSLNVSPGRIGFLGILDDTTYGLLDSAYLD